MPSTIRCKRSRNPWHLASVVVGLLLGFPGSGLASPDSPTSPVSTGWGMVSEPGLPARVCTTLVADLVPVKGSIDSLDSNPSQSAPDQQRIQAALDQCPSGSAVKLIIGEHDKKGFLSGPLTLPSGVTLWIDRDVTLYASRNPEDFDNGVGTCGTATRSKTRSCNDFIVANNTRHSGIVGEGTLDGRGGSLLTLGANANARSWWDVAYQNKSEGLYQQTPRLLHINAGSDFILYGVAFENSPNFHIVPDKVTGVTAWGIKILSPSQVYTQGAYQCPENTTPDKLTPATCFTPQTVKNTDGFDPSHASKVLLAYSYISTGDDQVAIKSSGSRQTSHALMFTHNHFYYGHGMSIGSETDAGVSDVLVDDLTMDGFDSANSNGLHIKSDSSRGGLVNHVTYQNVCMRRMQAPILLDSYYGTDTGTKLPHYTHIVFKNIHSLGSAIYGAGTLTWVGYPGLPIELSLDNVVLDGGTLTFAGSRHGSPISPANVHVEFSGGRVSFYPQLLANGLRDSVLTGTPAAGATHDCSHAFVSFKTVLPDAPF
ncbi:polygalacturonase [Pseudomonas sp. CDFA 602]|uniref:glycoside hydrolase family 28 protein n=1 Tax=Pseudomonas californiensis TaxID=2829823 RepID=UPI001E4AA3A0|nr:glycosyl hydrolase family 28 protein [Pseudomonas californiensis]MCD5995710.1 polygalacturonase [Pseudomonas californiensis]MCD6001304.1 polygalacturonase [Pseudomonas californiensis]